MWESEGKVEASQSEDQAGCISTLVHHLHFHALSVKTTTTSCFSFSFSSSSSLRILFARHSLLANFR
jgi:hypothetical protein